jgi:hypothetical protein
MTLAVGSEILYGGRVFDVRNITHSFRDGDWTVCRVHCDQDFFDIDLIVYDPEEWPIWEANLAITEELPPTVVAPIFAIFEPDNFPGFRAIVTQIRDDHYEWERLTDEPIEDDEAAKSIFRQLINHVEVLRQCRVHHRAISLVNLYFNLTSSEVRLTGFQFAERYEELSDDIIQSEHESLAECGRILVPFWPDLMEGLTRENPAERLTLQQVKGHCGAPMGTMDLALDATGQFESFRDLR